MRQCLGNGQRWCCRESFRFLTSAHINVLERKYEKHEKPE
jgi:hypothetical protein